MKNHIVLTILIIATPIFCRDITSNTVNIDINQQQITETNNILASQQTANDTALTKKKRSRAPLITVICIGLIGVGKAALTIAGNLFDEQFIMP